MILVRIRRCALKGSRGGDAWGTKLELTLRKKGCEKQRKKEN